MCVHDLCERNEVNEVNEAKRQESFWRIDINKPIYETLCYCKRDRNRYAMRSSLVMIVESFSDTTIANVISYVYTERTVIPM